MEPAKDVDEYISRAPNDLQGRLRELRATIRAAAPKAQERISYGMPYYHYKGRLVYFQLWKNHIGLYAITTPLEEYKAELEGSVTPKGTIRFPLDEELPLALIKKLVRAQVAANEQSDKKK